MINSNNKDTESLWYEQIAEEIEKGEVDKGLWTKAVSLSENDSKRIESEYIKLRFSKLKKESATERKGVFVKKLTGFLKGFAVFLVLGIVAFLVVSSLEDTKQSDFVKVTAVEKSLKEDATTIERKDLRSVEVQVAKNSTDGAIIFSDLDFKNLGQSVPNKVTVNADQKRFIFDENVTTDGSFLQVSILVTNDSDAAQYISVENASLYDKEERRFTLLNNIFNEKLGNNNLLNPYIPRKFEFLFEVPPDVVTGKLEIEYAISGGAKNEGRSDDEIPAVEWNVPQN
jgi:hypothetical protein